MARELGSSRLASRSACQGSRADQLVKAREPSSSTRLASRFLFNQKRCRFLLNKKGMKFSLVYVFQLRKTLLQTPSSSSRPEYSPPQSEVPACSCSPVPSTGVSQAFLFKSSDVPIEDSSDREFYSEKFDDDGDMDDTNIFKVPEFPSKLFFFCEVEPGSGGETPIVLSHIVYERMKHRHPEFVEKLEQHGLIYTRVLGEEDDPSSPIGRGWKSTFLTDDKNLAEERPKKSKEEAGPEKEGRKELV